MMPKHIIACARRDCVDILEYAARLPAGRGPAVDSTGNVADDETLIKIAPRGHHVGEREPIPVQAENIAPLALINEPCGAEIVVIDEIETSRPGSSSLHFAISVPNLPNPPPIHH